MEERLNVVFSENLRHYLELNGKTQADLCAYMHVSSATVSDWCNGKKMPRVDKIQAICNWLGIGLDTILSESGPENDGYYINPETARLAQEMFDDPQMRSLFHMKRNMEPEKFKAHYDMMKKMYQLEHPEDGDDWA